LQLNYSLLRLPERKNNLPALDDRRTRKSWGVQKSCSSLNDPLCEFLKFPGRVPKIILPQMTPTATFFKYIPSKKKIQATLIYFSKALQMKDFCHFCQFSFVS